MSDPQIPGWYPDPFGRHVQRYWNGSAWSDQVSDGGPVSTDPPDAPGATSTGTRLPPAPGAVTAATPVAGAPGAFPGPPGAPAQTGGGRTRSPLPLILGGLVVVLLIVVGIVVLTGGDDGGDGDNASSNDETTDTSAPTETTEAPSSPDGEFSGTISAADPVTVQQVELEAGQALAVEIAPDENLDVFGILALDADDFGEPQLAFDGVIDFAGEEPHVALRTFYEFILSSITATGVEGEGGADLSDAFEGDFDGFRAALAEIDPDLGEAGIPFATQDTFASGQAELVHAVVATSGTYEVVIAGFGATEGDFDATLAVDPPADDFDPDAVDPDADDPARALREEYGKHLELFCGLPLAQSSLCDEAALADFVAGEMEPEEEPMDPPVEESVFQAPVEPEAFIIDFHSLPQFDPVAFNCFAGDMSECNRLYRNTPVGDAGSYEDYGASCGGRLVELMPNECRRLARTNVVILGYTAGADPVEAITEFGSVPEFDELVVACQGNDIAACDELYRVTPVGDERSYENYGATCGYRLQPPVPGECVERLG